MQDTTSLPIETRQLFNAAFKVSVALGRKFEASDMTVELRQAARAYASLSDATEGFMFDMRDRVLSGQWGLSDGQCKGILNVLAADARRKLAQRAPKVAADAPQVEVPLGTFTIVALDGSRTTIRLQEPRSKDGRVFASFLMGADNDVDFQYFATLRNGVMSGQDGSFAAQRQAVRAILAPAADLRAMGLAYSLQSSNCWRCGRTLTVPASIYSGLGPECAAKVGAAYGEPPVAAAALEDTAAADKETAVEAPAPVAPTAAPDSVGVTREEAEAAENARYWAIAERAKLEGRSRTYDEIFGRDND